MKINRIYSNPQDNGLWGAPINLKRIKYEGQFSLFDNKIDQKTLSAVIIVFNQLYNKPFKCYFYNDKILFQIINGEKFIEYYNNFGLIDNTLYVFKDDNDKLVFNRMIKLKKINENLQYR